MGYGIIATDDVLVGNMGCLPCLRAFLLAAASCSVCGCACETKRYAYHQEEAKAGILVGVVNFCGFFVSVVGALYTDTAKSGMLTGAYVIFVPVVYCFLRKKFQWRALLNALVFLLGMFFLFDLKSAGGNFNRGDALTLACAGFFAVQIILVDKFADDINVFNFSALQMLTMGLCGLVGAVIAERNTFAAVDWSVCLPAVLYLGALSSAYAYIDADVCASRISPSLAAILLSLESPCGVLFSLTAGKVGWSLSLALGCAIMVAASVSAAVGDSKPSPAPALRPKEAEPTTEPLAKKKEEASCEDEEAISGAFNAAYAPVRPKE
ncbi:MAG: DMT family transporter [Christensenellaceae bacterium]